jgi:hypothetical protein
LRILQAGREIWLLPAIWASKVPDWLKAPVRFFHEAVLRVLYQEAGAVGPYAWQANPAGYSGVVAGAGCRQALGQSHECHLEL